MTSRITKLVLVPLEEWKRLNKNGGGVGGGVDTYTTIEIYHLNLEIKKEEEKSKKIKN